MAARQLHRRRASPTCSSLAERRQGVTGGRALARRAAELGHEVSHTTVNKIMAGRADNRVSTVSAPSMRSPRWPTSPAHARMHCSGPSPAQGDPFAAELPAEADLLNRRQRDVVLSVVRALARRSRAERRTTRHRCKAVARRRQPLTGSNRSTCGWDYTRPSSRSRTVGFDATSSYREHPNGPRGPAVCRSGGPAPAAACTAGRDRCHAWRVGRFPVSR